MKRRTANWVDAESDAGREGAADGMTSDGDGDGKGDFGPRWERRLRQKDLAAVGDVRAALRELLARWGAPGRAETARLLASELVTNALVHTDGGAVVTVTLGGGDAAEVKGRLRVEVRDFVARHPTLHRAGLDGDPESVIAGAATSGRGLLLVHSLADAWGVRAHGVGKSVWFELEAQEP